MISRWRALGVRFTEAENIRLLATALGLATFTATFGVAIPGGAAANPHEWHALPPIPGIHDPTLASDGGVVYALSMFFDSGRNNGPVDSNRLRAYEPGTGTWHELAGMPSPALQGAAAVVEGRLHYAGGGDIGDWTTNVLRMYDPGTGVWTVKAPMPASLKRTAGVAIEDKLYVLGGWCHNNCRASSFYEYDSSRDSWRSLPNLPWSGDAFAAALNGNVYAVGGWDVTGYHFAVFEFATNAWRSLPAPPDGFGYGPGIAAFDGKIWYHKQCGLTCNQPFAAFDPATGTWTRMGTVSPPLSRVTGTHAGVYALALNPSSDGTTPFLRYGPPGGHDALLEAIRGGGSGGAAEAVDAARREIRAAINTSTAELSGSIADVRRFLGTLRSEMTERDAALQGSLGELREEIRRALPPIDPGPHVEVLAMKLPTPLSSSAAVWDGRHVYLFGGRPCVGCASDQILRFDPSTGQLTRMGARLPAPAFRAAAVWTGTAAYVFGGVGSSGASSESLRTILQYDPAKDALTTMGARFPGGVRAAAATWDGRHAYIFGGDGTSDTFRYDPATDSLAALSPRIYGNTGAAHDGTYSYVFGGWTGGASLDSITRFDHETGTSTTLPEKIPKRHALRAAWAGDAAYLFGGHDGGTDFQDILRYDPAGQAVEILETALPSGRHDAEAVWTGKSIYVFGGGTGSAILDEIIRFTPATPPTTLDSVRTDVVWAIESTRAALDARAAALASGLATHDAGLLEIRAVTLDAIDREGGATRAAIDGLRGTVATVPIALAAAEVRLAANVSLLKTQVEGVAPAVIAHLIAALAPLTEAAGAARAAALDAQGAARASQLASLASLRTIVADGNATRDRLGEVQASIHLSVAGARGDVALVAPSVNRHTDAALAPLTEAAGAARVAALDAQGAARASQLASLASLRTIVADGNATRDRLGEAQASIQLSVAGARGDVALVAPSVNRHTQAALDLLRAALESAITDESVRIRGDVSRVGSRVDQVAPVVNAHTSTTVATSERAIVGEVRDEGAKTRREVLAGVASSASDLSSLLRKVGTDLSDSIVAARDAVVASVEDARDQLVAALDRAESRLTSAIAAARDAVLSEVRAAQDRVLAGLADAREFLAGRIEESEAAITSSVEAAKGEVLLDAEAREARLADRIVASEVRVLGQTARKTLTIALEPGVSALDGGNVTYYALVSLDGAPVAPEELVVEVDGAPSDFGQRELRPGLYVLTLEIPSVVPVSDAPLTLSRVLTVLASGGDFSGSAMAVIGGASGAPGLTGAEVNAAGAPEVGGSERGVNVAAVG